MCSSQTQPRGPHCHRELIGTRDSGQCSAFSSATRQVSVTIAHARRARLVLLSYRHSSRLAAAARLARYELAKAYQRRTGTVLTTDGVSTERESSEAAGLSGDWSNSDQRGPRASRMRVAFSSGQSDSDETQLRHPSLAPFAAPTRTHLQSYSRMAESSSRSTPAFRPPACIPCLLLTDSE